MQGFRNRLFLISSLMVPWLSFGLTPAGGLRDQVLSDVPGKLELEVRLPEVNLIPVDGQGVRVACALCPTQSQSGLPDLPRYRFTVLTGPSDPQVVVQILESETRSLPGGIASVPFSPTPSRTEYHPIAETFRAASGTTAKLGNIRYLRGLPVRNVDVPLALWSDNNKTLTLLKRVRVEVTFPGVRGQRAQGRLQGAFAGAVKNPIGGAYLYADARPALRRSGGPTGLAKSGVLAKSANASLTGKFLRIEVGDRNLESFSEDQVYGLSFSDLAKITGDISGARIANLRLFTGNNDTLPRFMDSTISDFGTLREIPIQVVDNNHNNTFDGNDSIIFFAHGTSIWKRIPGNQGPIRYEFSADPYSFENYYYLEYSGDQPGTASRMGDGVAFTASSKVRASTYAYVHAERDLQTAACDPSNHKDEETGFDWFWYWKGACDSYVDSAYNLTHAKIASDETDTLRDLDSGIPGDSIYAGFFIYSGSLDSLFKVYYGGKGDTLDLLRDHASHGSYYVWTGAVKNAPAFPLDSVIWSGREKRFEGYTISYRRKHVFSGKPLWIFPSDFGERVTYKVQGGSGLRCLRIDDGVATQGFDLDAQGTFTDSLGPDADSKYFVYQTPAALIQDSITVDGVPDQGTAVQDLRTGDNQNPEYVIITDKPLLSAAVDLKNYRFQSNRAVPLKTSVVLVRDIYRQFSSGRMSPVAIRDFLRWAYNNWGGTNPASNPLKYVLLFGDGHYDYRNIKASLMKSPPPNFIPPYELIVEGGREEIASDDFYGWLDSKDNSIDAAQLDVALGRVPLQTPDQAADFVQKIRDYEDPSKGGEWRGRAVFAADDGTQRGSPGDLDPITQGHTNDTERLGQAILNNEPGTTIDKVYELDYPLNSSFHKPEAAQDLLTFINRGAVLVNYVGHGASNQLADEVLMQTNDALSRMHNQGKTPMFNAFSCTVGRFESLIGEGMSEQFVKQKGIGAIGAIAATRESFPNPNISLANAFYTRAFPVDSSGQIETVGDALRDAKNSTTETGYDNLNDMKYELLGEPVMLLRKPPIKVSFTHILDTIKALDCSTITGKISGGSGNGFINIKILAGSIRKTYILPPGMQTQYADKRGNILFERTFPYKDFAFSTEYFIPKQISFGDTNAQILAYAWDGEKEMEGSTARRNLRIQGTAVSACSNDSDGRGPRIRITGCERKETGEVDFPDHVKLALPYCLQIEVADSTGGVLSAEGPDEGTTVEIPGVMDPFHPQPGIDELYNKSYQVTLDKTTVHPGPHLLKVSARDGYGNISMRQVALEVTQDSSINTVTAYNAPNPMKRNGTVFYFSTVLPSPDVDYSDAGNTQRLDFEIRIFNQSGNLVKVFQQAQSGSTSWDGHDDWGNLLANGVYFYKITARQNLAAAGIANPNYRTVSSKRNILVISR